MKDPITSDMVKLMSFIRGQVLEPFTWLEFQMNEIIRKTSFDSEEIFDRYMDVLGINNLRMSAKINLFEICLDKFEKKHNLDISDLRKHLPILIKQRNYLAHCPLNIRDSGIEHYKKTKKLMLIGKRNKNDGSFEIIEFAKEETKSLVALTETLTSIMMLMHSAIENQQT